MKGVTGENKRKRQLKDIPSKKEDTRFNIQGVHLHLLLIVAFSYPDCTVGPGIAPDQPVRLADLRESSYRRSGIGFPPHPALKDYHLISIFNCTIDCDCL
jgi:hypothetical protein